MQRIWLVVALGGLLPGAVVVGCNAIAGIQEGVSGGDASSDSTTESAAHAESGPMDAGVNDSQLSGEADSGMHCGELGHVCCETPGTPACGPELTCNGSGFCVPGASNVGKPCGSGSTCPSGICLPAGVCTVPCGGDAGTCPQTWTCAPDVNGVKVCTCTKTNGGVEICDGLDNDCDGVVDNGGDAYCVSMGLGTLAACAPSDGGGAACSCATTNNQCMSDLCADLQHDAKNCGRCGRDCQYPMGGGCDGGQCGAFTFVDSTAFDAGGAQRIGGIAVDSSYVYFTYSGPATPDVTSILRCPANSPGACSSPETVVDGIEGGAGFLSIDPSSGVLAGTTGVPGGKTGVAYIVMPDSGGSPPSVVVEGTLSPTVNRFASGVAINLGGAIVEAWIDTENAGIDMTFPGDAEMDFLEPSFGTSPAEPTVLITWPSHNAVFYGTYSSLGGQIGLCQAPGCGRSGQAGSTILNGNGLFGAPNGLAFDGTTFYIAASGINGAAGGIYAAARNMVTIPRMAVAQNPTVLTLDSVNPGQRVYWVDAASSQQTIQWCTTTGCPTLPTLPYSIDVSAAPANSGTSVLVTDDTSLYWNATTPAGGSVIQRVALP